MVDTTGPNRLIAVAYALDHENEARKGAVDDLCALASEWEAERAAGGYAALVEQCWTEDAKKLAEAERRIEALEAELVEARKPRVDFAFVGTAPPVLLGDLEIEIDPGEKAGDAAQEDSDD